MVNEYLLREYTKIYKNDNVFHLQLTAYSRGKAYKDIRNN